MGKDYSLRKVKTSSMDGAFWRLMFGTPCGLIVFVSFFIALICIVFSVDGDPDSSQLLSKRSGLLAIVIMSTVLGGLTWFFAWIFYAIEGSTAKCPICKRWFSACPIAVQHDKVGEGKRREIVSSSFLEVSGRPVGRIDKTEVVDINIIRETTSFRCKNCGHNWSSSAGRTQRA